MKDPLWTRSKRIQWALLCVSVLGAIGYFGLYRECHKLDGVEADVHKALRCALGRPPLRADQIEERYQMLATGMRARGIDYPARCAPLFWKAGEYRGSGTGNTTRAVAETGNLLRSGDDAAIVERLRWLAEEWHYTDPGEPGEPGD